jgi:hypothetical protein
MSVSNHKGREHEHDHAHGHNHDPEKISGDPATEILRLRKMVEHWIHHNEEHASSYRLWASRAEEAGCNEAAVILEEIASEIGQQNERFLKIVRIIDSSGGDR